MGIPQVSREDFRILSENPKFPFLVEFFASWCETCNLQEKVLVELKDRVGGQVAIGKVDMDQNPLLAARNMILSVPTTLLFWNAKLLGRLEGYAGEEKIASFLEENLAVPTGE